MAQIIFPALDILNGDVVQLKGGDYTQSVVYSDDPLQTARQWQQQGAEWLHLVDLDGAASGSLVNVELVKQIITDITIPVQLGGGLRTLDTIIELLDLGLARVILGTAALDDQLIVKGLIETFGGERLAVAADIKNSQLAIKGWTEETQEPVDILRVLKELGVSRFVYTSVDNDGLMQGPDLVGAAEIARIVYPNKLIYSGGIGSLDDIRKLRSLSYLEGMIIGTALYEKKFTLAEANAAIA